jgi:hypothetical protein
MNMQHAIYALQQTTLAPKELLRTAQRNTLEDMEIINVSQPDHAPRRQFLSAETPPRNEGVVRVVTLAASSLRLAPPRSQRASLL